MDPSNHNELRRLIFRILGKAILLSKFYIIPPPIRGALVPTGFADWSLGKIGELLDPTPDPPLMAEWERWLMYWTPRKFVPFERFKSSYLQGSRWLIYKKEHTPLPPLRLRGVEGITICMSTTPSTSGNLTNVTTRVIGGHVTGATSRGAMVPHQRDVTGLDRAVYAGSNQPWRQLYASNGRTPQGAHRARD